MKNYIDYIKLFSIPYGANHNAEENQTKVDPRLNNIVNNLTELSKKDDGRNNDFVYAYSEPVVPNRTYPVVVSRIINGTLFSLCIVDFSRANYLGLDIYMLLNQIRADILKSINNGEIPEPTPPSRIRLYPNEFIMMINV